jgi:hypothetical protein
MLAFVIGSVAGVLIGFWFARSRASRGVRSLREDDQRAAARRAGADLRALVRLGIWSKVALGVTLVFFIVFFNVYQGVKEVSPTVLANARMLGMSERQLMRHVYWPSALSWMFSSLHTSVGFRGGRRGGRRISRLGRRLGYISSRPKACSTSPACSPHVRARGVRDRDRHRVHARSRTRLLVWRPVASMDP